MPFQTSLDLVGIDDFNHGKRVGYMATECARALGVSEDQQKFIYRAGLIHDCGVSSTKVHKKLVDELDWSESNQHCVTGANRLSQFPPLHRYVDIIRHHHRSLGRSDRNRSRPLHKNNQQPDLSDRPHKTR